MLANPASERGGAPRGAKRRRAEQRADDPEQHGAVAHQHEQVRVADRHAVERLEPRRREHAQHRQQVAQAHEQIQRGREAAHSLGARYATAERSG